MKKFISTIMAVALLLPLCVSVANAATYENPIIHVYSELYDNGDDVQPDSPHQYYNKPEGYDVYKISYTTEGVDLSEETLTVLTIKFSISDSSKIHSKSWSKYVISGKGTKDLNGALPTYGDEPNSINPGAYSWTKEDGVGVDLYDWDTNPAGGTEEISSLIDTLIYVQKGESVTFTYQTELVPAAEEGNWDTTSFMEIKTDATGAKRGVSTALRYTVNGVVGNVLTLGAPATVDVTSVTISGATNATVGDNVQLSAAVLPDNATDKTVTWTKVSGNGAVSDSGVVTATAAGDVVVKATAGGVDSANYTVSFAAAAPADIVPEVADKGTYTNATDGLYDAKGHAVVIDPERSYGAAKFENVVVDDGEYVYKVFVTGTNKTTGAEESASFDIANESLEITGASVSFIAIVRSATRTITSVVLKAFKK